MYKRCSTCKHCIIDMKALNIGCFIEHCKVNGHFIRKPFWSGWGCRFWEAQDGK